MTNNIHLKVSLPLLSQNLTISLYSLLTLPTRMDHKKIITNPNTFHLLSWFYTTPTNTHITFFFISIFQENFKKERSYRISSQAENYFWWKEPNHFCSSMELFMLVLSMMVLFMFAFHSSGCEPIVLMHCYDSTMLLTDGVPLFPGRVIR